MPTNSVDHVYLARHGRTALNADGRLRGLCDPPLDEVGQVQAKRLAKALAAYGPMVVIGNPLQRVVATAQEIGAAAHIRVVIRETKQTIPENLSAFTKVTKSPTAPSALLSGLTVQWRRGPSSATMAAAVGPYTAWISATAGQAEQTATHARAAASAFETAFAATVPTPVVAVNDPSLKSNATISLRSSESTSQELT